MCRDDRVDLVATAAEAAGDTFRFVATFVDADAIPTCRVPMVPLVLQMSGTVLVEHEYGTGGGDHVLLRPMGACEACPAPVAYELTVQVGAQTASVQGLSASLAGDALVVAAPRVVGAIDLATVDLPPGEVRSRVTDRALGLAATDVVLTDEAVVP